MGNLEIWEVGGQAGTGKLSVPSRVLDVEILADLGYLRQEGET